MMFPPLSVQEVDSAPVAAAGAGAMDPAQEALLKEKRKQLLRGCKTVVVELAGECQGLLRFLGFNASCPGLQDGGG